MFTLKNLLKIIGRNTLISLIAVSISIFTIFFIRKGLEHITNNIILNNKLEAELVKKTELFSVIKQDAQIVGTNDVLIGNAFVPSNNISEFLTALDKLASNNGLTQMYRFETPVPSTISQSFPLSTVSYSDSLTTTGVAKLSTYLKSFEALPYFTNIESINISSQDKNGWTGLTTMTLKETLITKATQ